MALTPKERREKNRANARKSTGPKTKEGKAKSRCNALKHGHTALKLSLPNENSHAIAERVGAWQDYYQPESPGAQHLVELCVGLTLQTDRINRDHHEAISSQVRSAELDWDHRQECEVADYKSLLPVNPTRAVRELSRSALGCEYLLGRWEQLAGMLRVRGSWAPGERDEVVLLSGIRSEVTVEEGGLKSHPEVFQLCYYNALASSVDPRTTARAYCDPDFLPERFWATFTPDNPPARHLCQAWLAQFAARKIDALRKTRDFLERRIDGPDRAGAQARASTLNDHTEAMRHLRYSADARNGFLRTFALLLKTLEADKAHAEDDLFEDETPEPIAEAAPQSEASAGSARDTDPADFGTECVRHADDAGVVSGPKPAPETVAEAAPRNEAISCSKTFQNQDLSRAGCAGQDDTRPEQPAPRGDTLNDRGPLSALDPESEFLEVLSEALRGPSGDAEVGST